MQLSLALAPDPLMFDMQERLVEAYGEMRNGPRHDPTSQCFKAMISSCTQDAVSQEAFWALKDRFPCWDGLADSTPAQIVELIRDVTYEADKAANLIDAARHIRARRGRVDLEFLGSWDTQAALGWLRRMRGIKAKSAAATLNFSTLRRRVFVVDRHVLRVFKSLGVLDERADFERGFRQLTRRMPDAWGSEDLYEFHWLVKRLGQSTCRHGSQHCSLCPLRDICPTGWKARRHHRLTIARTTTSTNQNSVA